MTHGRLFGHRRTAATRRSFAAAAACAVACAGSPAAAQPESPATGDDPAPSRIAAAVTPHRLIRLFDFDDPRNPDPIPVGWERTTLTPDGRARKGFPRFNLAQLDNSVAASGQRSVRLPTDGGSTSLRLRGGEAAVFADADYAINALVRTDGLEHARAFISVRLLDQQLRVIPGSERRSEPLVSQGGWRPVTVHLPGGRSGAAWIQLDLELLQPEQFAPPVGDDPAAQALARHRLFREDVRGGAWFDDVAIMQIPRASITTLAPANIVHGDETPTLHASVRDLGGESLRARIRVFDFRGRCVDDRLEPIHPDGRPLSFAPKLPGFGWYAARLEVLGQAGGDTAAPVSAADTAFVWLAVGPAAIAGQESPASGSSPESIVRSRSSLLVERDRRRFGVLAERTSDDRIGDLPVLTSRLGTGFVYLPAWLSDSTLETTARSLEMRRPAIEALLRQGQALTFSLAGVPNELSRATQAPADDALSLSSFDRAQWMPYLAPMLDIFGQRVLRYQLGQSGVDHAYWKPSLATEVAPMEAALATLVPGPIISIPWPADRAFPEVRRPAAADNSTQTSSSAFRQTGSLVDSLTLWYPQGFPADAVSGVLDSLQPAPPAPTAAPDSARELTVVLDLPRAETFGATATLIELMRRTIELWAAQGDAAPASVGGTTTLPPGEDPRGAMRIALDQPWNWSTDIVPQILPAPQLATFATLRDRLSGRRIVGQLPNSAGVKCYILAARNTALGTLEQGALVAWNESAPPDRAIVDAAAVGSAVTVIDAFGNGTIIPVPGLDGGSESSQGNAASPLVTVPVGEMPVFIEGIDPYLALFAASVRLEPSFMPAVVREHEHRIILSNPWPVRITGKLQLKEDDDRAPRLRAGRTLTDEWRVTPGGIIDFDMAPGETAAIPVTLSFGPAQLAGIKDFIIVARAMADRPYPPIRMRAAVEIGLEDIEMTPELQVNATGDIIVVVAVTNTGTRPRTLRLDTAARNMPSQQLQISDLPPGQTVLRRFVFNDAAKELSGRRVVITLSDLDEAQRLNKAVAVP